MTGGVGPGHFFEDLYVGMEASLVQIVGGDDIHAFAQVTVTSIRSTSTMPMQGNAVQAAYRAWNAERGLYLGSIRYEAPRAGMRVYLADAEFRAPVHIGDHVTATVKISDLIEHRKRAIFSCQCAVGEKVVLEGEAVIMIPSRTPKSKE